MAPDGQRRVLADERPLGCRRRRVRDERVRAPAVERAVPGHLRDIHVVEAVVEQGDGAAPRVDVGVHAVATHGRGGEDVERGAVGASPRLVARARAPADLAVERARWGGGWRRCLGRKAQR